MKLKGVLHMPQNNLRAEVVNNETWNALIDAHTDVTGAAYVQVQIDRRHGVLHVNVNGVCLTRICQIKDFTVDELK
jgi:hypothetical protein